MPVTHVTRAQIFLVSHRVQVIHDFRELRWQLPVTLKFWQRASYYRQPTRIRIRSARGTRPTLHHSTGVASAMCVRALMIDRTMWSGSASELLSLCAERARADVSGTSWIKNPRALAGRLRRAQTFLRTLGIEITFSREGRTGTRMIRVGTSPGNSVSTVSTVSAARSNGSSGDQTNLPGIGE